MIIAEWFRALLHPDLHAAGERLKEPAWCHHRTEHAERGQVPDVTVVFYHARVYVHDPVGRLIEMRLAVQGLPRVHLETRCALAAAAKCERARRVVVVANGRREGIRQRERTRDLGCSVRVQE